MKRLVSLVTCASFFFQAAPALALDLEKSFSGRSAGQAEFFNSNSDKRMQIQVTILSGVARPGVHQVPDNTNLMDMLALAGGISEDADASKVLVRRRSQVSKGSFDTLSYDVPDILTDNKIAYPLIHNFDTIMVEPRPKTDQKLITALTIVASTVGIISGVVLLRKVTKD